MTMQRESDVSYWLVFGTDCFDSPKDLGRPSTIHDIADFVADFIVSDLLGVVSSRLMQSRLIDGAQRIVD